MAQHRGSLQTFCVMYSENTLTASSCSGLRQSTLEAAGKNEQVSNNHNRCPSRSVPYCVSPFAKRNIALTHFLEDDWTRSSKIHRAGPHAAQLCVALWIQSREALASEMKDGPWILL